MAGERFHMVQNVSMAVHHIGREPTVRATPPLSVSPYLFTSLSLSSVSRPVSLSLCPPLCLFVSLNLTPHFSVPISPSATGAPGSPEPALQSSQLHPHHLPIPRGPEQRISARGLLHQWAGLCR